MHDVLVTSASVFTHRSQIICIKFPKIGLTPYAGSLCQGCNIPPVIRVLVNKIFFSNAFNKNGENKGTKNKMILPKQHPQLF